MARQKPLRRRRDRKFGGPSDHSCCQPQTTPPGCWIQDLGGCGGSVWNSVASSHGKKRSLHVFVPPAPHTYNDVQLTTSQAQEPNVRQDGAHAATPCQAGMGGANARVLWFVNMQANGRRGHGGEGREIEDLKLGERNSRGLPTPFRENVYSDTETGEMELRAGWPTARRPSSWSGIGARAGPPRRWTRTLGGASRDPTSTSRFRSTVHAHEVVASNDGGYKPQISATTQHIVHRPEGEPSWSRCSRAWVEYFISP